MSAVPMAVPHDDRLLGSGTPPSNAFRTVRDRLPRLCCCCRHPLAAGRERERCRKLLNELILGDCSRVFREDGRPNSPLVIERSLMINEGSVFFAKVNSVSLYLTFFPFRTEFPSLTGPHTPRFACPTVLVVGDPRERLRDEM